MNWSSGQEPCTLELGPAWRIPTSTEWNNAKAGGDWTNWNGPYNSALKLHVAGALSNGSGSLLQRGSYGYYWSSMQYNAIYGYNLRFQYDLALMDYIGKDYGFTLRCVRDF